MPSPSFQSLRDCPRPIVRTPATKIVRFSCQAQTALKAWMAAIVRARDAHIRFLDDSRRSAMQSVSDFLFEEHAVNLVVCTRIPIDSDTDADAAVAANPTPDWQISVTHDGTSSSGMFIEATRHVRLVQGLDGLGLTLVGKNPVVVQEVEEDGPAHAAGVLVGDAIRAVNTIPCADLVHHQVVDLIRDALRTPSSRTKGGKGSPSRIDSEAGAVVFEAV